MDNNPDKTATKVVKSTIKYTFKSYKITEDELLLPNGKPCTHFTLVHPGAVVVAPITSNDELIFVRQYRHSIGVDLLELPAGKLEQNELPEISAKRELAEEIGFSSDHIESLGIIYPAPGFCSEVLHLFCATDLYPFSLPADEDENIKIEKIKISELDHMIKKNVIVDAKSMAMITKLKILGKIS